MNAPFWCVLLSCLQVRCHPIDRPYSVMLDIRMKSSQIPPPRRKQIWACCVWEDMKRVSVYPSPFLLTQSAFDSRTWVLEMWYGLILPPCLDLIKRVLCLTPLLQPSLVSRSEIWSFVFLLWGCIFWLTVTEMIISPSGTASCFMAFPTKDMSVCLYSGQVWACGSLIPRALHVSLQPRIHKAAE